MLLADMNAVLDSIKNTTPKSLLEYAKTSLIAFLPRLAGALLLLIVAYFSIKGLVILIKRFLKASHVDATLHSFILGIFKTLSWIVVIIMALLILRVPVSPLVAVLGSVGLAFSFAIRDNLANITGGVSILFSRPFLKGDLIEVNGVAGEVKSIELFYTRIITDDNKAVYLPNGDIAKSVVTNHSAEPLQRADLTFLIPADIDFEKAKTIIGAIVAESAHTLKSPAPLISVNEKTKDGRVISCRVWVKARYYDDAFERLQNEITETITKSTSVHV
ncbi:MAG: mechanosensitive ion channel family protein [Oscillospiraceae bacterium]|nr:mechanosensitive ion channel family protein [Oscillospiraceae bacterium]